MRTYMARVMCYSRSSAIEVRLYFRAHDPQSVRDMMRGRAVYVSHDLSAASLTGGMGHGGMVCSEWSITSIRVSRAKNPELTPIG